MGVGSGTLLNAVLCRWTARNNRRQTNLAVVAIAS